MCGEQLKNKISVYRSKGEQYHCDGHDQFALNGSLSLIIRRYAEGYGEIGLKNTKMVSQSVILFWAVLLNLYCDSLNPT